MLKRLWDHLLLSVKARTGLSAPLFISVGIAAIAAVMVFVFLCVSAYAWLSLKIGPVFGALGMAGIFLLVALAGILASTLLRQRTRQRAIVERAVRAPQGVVFSDPRMLSLVGQAARSLGWQRIAPVMLLGFLAAQWLHDARAARRGD
jgi:regulator of protease activity HflC (stomatin/prohibitin superfamily)